MKSEFSFALVGAALGVMFFARADEPITVERFPDADTVLVDECEKVRYNPDGTYETTDESWTKILTERGRRSESTVRLDYTKRYGEAKIVYVGAIDGQGVEREIDISGNLNEVTDNGSMSANIYDPLDRVITATVPGLKIGDTLHVKTWRKATKARCEGVWADLAVMEWSAPIIRSSFEVTAPKELPLKKIVIRHPLGNISTNLTVNADGSTTYLFTATNSAQVFPEPDMPPLYTQVQHVRVSTAESWPEISKWYWNLCAPHLAKTNAAMIAKVEELKLKSKIEDKDALMRAIFKFVSQEVRYMGLTMEDTSPGYAPHDVDVTFDNRYGVCRDKAGLLVAMLRLAGFKAFPVLIQVGAKQDKDVPKPYFNHAIVAVEKNGYILMDPTDENAKDIFPKYLADKSYLVARPEGEELMVTPVTPPTENELTVETEATLAKDGSIFAETKIAMNGINDTAYRHAFVKMTAEDRTKFFERVLKKLNPGSELIRLKLTPEDMRDTETPVEISFAANYPEMVLTGETRKELTVPFVSRVLGVANFLLTGNTSLEKRRYPLVLDTTARLHEKFTLDGAGRLGNALELPEPLSEEGGFVYRLSTDATNGTVIAEREVAIAALEFDPEEYQGLRESVKKGEAAARRKAVFALDREADADIHWILNSSETSVKSDCEWVTTNHIVKRVLTYAGKKSAAELKLNYAPSTRRLEIVSATVSNATGVVKALTPKEINEMDAGWTAAAPRYPASKILVANLPGVEIGSVIDYTIVATVTNAAAPFYSTYLFDGMEPVDRRIARVDGWRREADDLKLRPREPAQPDASLWRDIEFVSRCRFEKWDMQLSAYRFEEAGDSMRSIRDWMAKYVKIVGPGLWEIPFAAQLTPPETVLKERYASRLDYIRTLAALLRGAGYEADVVFTANNAADDELERERDKFRYPNVRAFSVALCRVRTREGGFLGLGGAEKEYFIGAENEYTPVGISDFEGSDYYDPERGEFGIVSVPREELKNCDSERSVYTIRENGAVDLDVEDLMRGAGVGAFRKKYAEILPEMRSRHYQQLLGSIAQAATATKDLETDVSGYPAKRAFSCFIPDFAVIGKDTVTLTVPPLISSVPSYTGKARLTPFAVGATDAEVEEVKVRFPEGYTRIEHLPESFVITNPVKPTEVWLRSTTAYDIVDGLLEVTLRREILPRQSAFFDRLYFEFINDCSRRLSSRANRTMVVGRQVWYNERIDFK